MHHEDSSGKGNAVNLPRPTVWPLVLALGISLVLAGMVTSPAVGLLGGLLALMGAVGWFGQVLPEEVHEAVAVSSETVVIASQRTLLRHPGGATAHRTILPFHSSLITTGLKGGIAGGIAMTVPAGIFSLVRYHSFWYATNLLAAGGFLSWAGASDAFLGQFHLKGALAALVIHGITSLLVGLLYGAMLQMFPKYPILTAGFVVPLLFTGVLYTALGVVSPILNQRIDWAWFIPSQIVFGLVCGYVVNLDTKVRTPQFQALPFAVRAGLHGDVGAMIQPRDRQADAPEESEGPDRKDTNS